MIIGITGSIGSGKTTAAKMFSKYHFTRIDADGIGHEILKSDLEVYKMLVSEFGSSILDKRQNIDRKKLGELVFNDEKKLKKLNSIMHPIIIEKIKIQIKKIKEKCGKDAKIIIDAPLLLETKAKDLVDKVVVVKASNEKIFGRLGNINDKEKINKILKAQMPIKEKIKDADFVIVNNGSLKDLERKVTLIIKKLE